MDSGYAERLSKKQEISFARRLWILLIIYEKALDGKNTDANDLMEKLKLSRDEVKTECNILKTSGLIHWDHPEDDGTPYGIELTGTAFAKIENAPMEHYDILEGDVRAIQKQGNNVAIKKLEIERLKQETKLKKWEVWVNITGTIENASKWFGVVFDSH